MSFERKDLVPYAIALVALGVQVGGFVNRALGWVVLLVAAALLGWYYLTRDQTITPMGLVSRATEAELREAKRARIRERLKELHGAINQIYLRFIVADTDEKVAEALAAYQQWTTRCRAVIADHFGEGEAEAFHELGPLSAASILVQHPELSLYRWPDKERWMQRLDLYRPRLSDLMRRADAL